MGNLKVMCDADAAEMYRGAAQPATQTRVTLGHGTSHTGADGTVTRCVTLNFSSFNFAVPQRMMTDRVSGQRQLANKVRSLIMQMGTLPSDIVLGCNLGGMRLGPRYAEHVDMDVIVQTALPGADFLSEGADFVVYNTDGRKNITLKVSGVTAVQCGYDVDLFWNIFELNYRGASQSAASSDGGDSDHPPVGFVVGILSIPSSFTAGNMTRAKRREIFRKSLDLLADAHFQEWPRDFPVARLLVGDCKMSEAEAVACLQDTEPPAASVQVSHPRRARALRSWQLFPSFVGLTGDLFAVMGCVCQPRIVALGHSFTERGPTDGRHDAVGAILSIPYQIISGTPSQRPS